MNNILSKIVHYFGGDLLSNTPHVPLNCRVDFISSINPTIEYSSHLIYVIFFVTCALYFRKSVYTVLAAIIVTQFYRVCLLEPTRRGIQMENLLCRVMKNCKIKHLNADRIIHLMGKGVFWHFEPLRLLNSDDNGFLLEDSECTAMYDELTRIHSITFMDLIIALFWENWGVYVVSVVSWIIIAGCRSFSIGKQ